MPRRQRYRPSDYSTIFSLLTLVVVSPPVVTVCSTSVFFAVASFLANFFFGFSETIFDLPALTLALATALCGFQLLLLALTGLLDRFQLELAAFRAGILRALDLDARVFDLDRLRLGRGGRAVAGGGLAGEDHRHRAALVVGEGEDGAVGAGLGVGVGRGRRRSRRGAAVAELPGVGGDRAVGVAGCRAAQGRGTPGRTFAGRAREVSGDWSGTKARPPAPSAGQDRADQLVVCGFETMIESR